MAAVPSTIDSLKDDHFYVRYQAAHELVLAGEVSASLGPSLAHLVQHDESRLVRHEAAKAICAMGPANTTRHIGALHAALADSEMLVRRDAAKALSQIGAAASPCAKALAERLEDEFWPVRLWAAKALFVLGSAAVPYAIPLTLRAVKDDDVAVREAAAEALGAMGEKAAPHIKDLGEYFCSDLSEEEMVRVRQALVFALGDPETAVRKAARTGLDELAMQAKKNVVDNLHLLQDPKRKAWEHHHVEMLLEMLIDEDWLTRRHALESMRRHVRREIHEIVGDTT